MTAELLVTTFFKTIELVGIFSVVMGAVAYAIWLERKVLGAMQLRKGVLHVGPFGLLQPLTDVVKLTMKESFYPTGIDQKLYKMAPVIVFVPAITAFAVIPFSSTIYVADISISLLFVLALSSVGVFGIISAGWASNSKYPMISAMRVSAQIISYEIGLIIALLSPILVTGTLSLQGIMQYQDQNGWLIFTQLIAFVLFMMCGIAETNRAPFDLAEAETELVAGHFTEYTAMGFAMFFVAEYANIFMISCIAAIVFLGGWAGPFLPGLVWFVIKVYAIFFLYLWVRATLPRVRYDQLMALGWKVFIPVGLANLLVTAVVLYWIR